MKKTAVINKLVGQTPLEAAELWRTSVNLPTDVPLAYAGRLDPMASGVLLILIGDECKNQSHYHGLDKEYEFEILLSAHSDTGDVLGLVDAHQASQYTKQELQAAATSLIGEVQLPYPHFSSKTVSGKPLHTWALEGRIDEIKIPTKTSTLHTLHITDLRTASKESVYQYATEKIELIPPVTDEKKAIGNDFRRPDVRNSWAAFRDNPRTPESFQIVKVRCIASSGTYMRTLADEIAKQLDTRGLAYSIHRTKIGSYYPLPYTYGFWKKRYR